MSIPVILHGQKPPLPTAKEIGAVNNNLGLNPITSITDDTVANWANLGSGIAAYNSASQLNDQPSTNGILTNICRGNHALWVFQIWSAQGGAMYVRSGRQDSGWVNSWRKVYDSVNKPTLSDVGGSNENLIVNGNFTNLINTNGQIEYSAATDVGAQAFNNWGIHSGIATLQNDGVLIKNSIWYGRFYQRIKQSLLNSLVGKQVTLSALVKTDTNDNQLQISIYNVSDNTSNGTNTFVTINSGISLVTVSFIVPESYKDKWCEVLLYGSTNHPNEDAYAIKYIAAKLELGNAQTLAHKENNIWVLNELMPNKDLELLKSQGFETPHINTSLVDNGNFINPVNRRNFTSVEDSVNQVYYNIIDGWFSCRVNASLVDKGLSIALNESVPDSTNGYIQQRININKFIGDTYTLSMIINDKLYSGIYRNVAEGNDYTVSFLNGTIQINLECGWGDHRRLTVRVFSTTPQVISAIKLEPGEIQTLAHQDVYGNWVLNDSSDYALQYAICMQYDLFTGDWTGEQYFDDGALKQGDNIDTITRNGIFLTVNGVSGTFPPNSTTQIGVLINKVWDVNYQEQLFFSYEKHLLYMRHKIGTWQGWGQIFSEHNRNNTFSLGQNVTGDVANDTIETWRQLGSGHAFFFELGKIVDQPSTYGILVNYCVGTEIFQLWKTMGVGPIYYRTGNESGWITSWKILYSDDSTLIVPIKEDYTTYKARNIAASTGGMTAGSTALSNGNIYLQYE